MRTLGNTTCNGDSLRSPRSKFVNASFARCRKRAESVISRSEVKTPAVIKYMEKLWTDESGLAIYEKDDGDDQEVEMDSPTGLSKSKVPLSQIQANSIIDSWCKSFELEKDSYESISVFAEVRLKVSVCEAVISNVTLLTSLRHLLGRRRPWLLRRSSFLSRSRRTRRTLGLPRSALLCAATYCARSARCSEGTRGSWRL